MRIAIDYTAAIRQGAGIGTYVRRLVDAMLALDTTNSYTLLTSGRPGKDHPFPEGEHVRGRSMLIPDRYLNILWYRWRAPLPANLFTGPIDIYHNPDFVLPPLNKRTRKIVTVHDLAFLEHPEYAAPALAAYLSQVVPRAINEADVIATVSHEVSRTLIKHFQAPVEKLTVIPNGVGSYFKRVSDPVLLEATRNKFGLKLPFILAVGTLEPRKNHLGLIKAYHQLYQQKKAPAMLAIAGGKGWLYDETHELVSKLKLEKRVLFLGRVSDLELVHLYSMAQIFAFPSFFEGFGIPPIEAMACGAPVITSNISSLPEVVGEAALKVDPYSIDELAHAIAQLTESETLRQELRQKGYEQARKFTWEQSARKMLSVYQRLYEGQTNFSDEVAIS
ncbi:glycosyltransferase family 4 protein [Ktedonospora formicarum]|uniref:Glycosyl transferase family 1 n=1 Tax=Ktedonospora formicarum TaxID=2778364 RepID=A0A8J3I552_9CHLR|nr:glycosyltransferase family 1 protein [Ktedonospora formicarum]GHO44979.1 glycosyl transferase family 1 [Ktedonospora formicarum]